MPVQRRYCSQCKFLSPKKSYKTLGLYWSRNLRGVTDDHVPSSALVGKLFIKLFCSTLRGESFFFFFFFSYISAILRFTFGAENLSMYLRSSSTIYCSTETMSGDRVIKHQIPKRVVCNSQTTVELSHSTKMYGDNLNNLKNLLLFNWSIHKTLYLHS